jgi:LuxR family transcriptional regulator, maltose regulon positive regulatory protein
MAPRRAAAGLAAAQMVQLMAESAPPPSDAALTHGETLVLRYLPTNLSAREIAGELYPSVNTVKTQQHLYQNSARAAVPRP